MWITRHEWQQLQQQLAAHQQQQQTWRETLAERDAQLSRPGQPAGQIHSNSRH